MKSALKRQNRGGEGKKSKAAPKDVERNCEEKESTSRTHPSTTERGKDQIEGKSASLDERPHITGQPKLDERSRPEGGEDHPVSNTEDRRPSAKGEKEPRKPK